MTLLNTIVSLFGIYKINLTVNDLKKMEPKLKTNHGMQTLHGLLLILQQAAVAMSGTVYLFYIKGNSSYDSYIVSNIVCVCIDFLV